MVTIGMNYKVLPGKGEAFEKMFNKVLEVMKEMEGHTKTFLYKDVNDSNSYMIASDWNSEEAFNAFMQSDKFRQVADWGKESILAGRPEHNIYKH